MGIARDQSLRTRAKSRILGPAFESGSVFRSECQISKKGPRSVLFQSQDDMNKKSGSLGRSFVPIPYSRFDDVLNTVRDICKEC